MAEHAFWDIDSPRALEYVQDLHARHQRIYCDLGARKTYLLIHHNDEYGYHTKLWGNRVFRFKGIRVRLSRTAQPTAYYASGEILKRPMSSGATGPRKYYLQPRDPAWNMARNRVDKEEIAVIRALIKFFENLAREDSERVARLMGEVTDVESFGKTFYRLREKYGLDDLTAKF